MDDLIQCLNTAENINVKLFFLIRRKNQRTKVITYDVRGAQILPDVAHDLRVNGYNQIHGMNSHDHETLPYGIISHSDRVVIETIDYQCVPFLVGILGEIARPTHDNIGDEDYSHVWGYIVRIENNNNTVFLFRKYTPKKLLEKGKLSCIINRSGQFAKLNGQAIALDSFYDAALFLEAPTSELPEESANLLIFSRGYFESLFSFIEEYQRQVEANQEYLRGKEILENVAQIVDTCSTDARAVRKLARILVTRPFESLNTTKIQETIHEYGLPVTLNEAGKIQVTVENIWIILRILDDDFVESKATGNKYESRSKRRYPTV